MAGKMERSYFEEKKQYALEGIDYANRTATEISGLLKSWSYDVPNIVDPAIIHDHIRAAKSQLDGVRINFEKVRWASTSTDLDFDGWLEANGCADLVRR